jgi:hypothetical protein
MIGQPPRGRRRALEEIIATDIAAMRGLVARLEHGQAPPGLNSSETGAKKPPGG